MSTPYQPFPSVAADPDDLESCPYCRESSGVQVIPGKVQKWSCAACRGQWWITIANPHVRRAFLDHLAVEVTARAVLQEVTTLTKQADTLTDGQLRARLISCWARLNQACRYGADPHAPARHRLNNEVPGAPPVPRTTG